jgi:hypothetical protein
VRCVQRIAAIGKRSARRIAALALLLCFAAAVLVPQTFIITHAGHEHDHGAIDGGCSVCVQMQAVGDALKRLAVALAVVSLAVAALPIGMPLVDAVSAPFGALSPMRLKVRLND